MPQRKKIKNFEEDLLRLEKISELLENNEIGLDKAVSLYEEGIGLSKSCIKKLKEAELKITELKKELTEITAGGHIE